MSKQVVFQVEWNNPPAVPEGHAAVWPLFTILVGNHKREVHWPIMQRKLLERIEEGLDMNGFKGGDIITLYDDDSLDIKILGESQITQQ